MQLTWRPSTCVTASLLAMGALGAMSAWVSDMPSPWRMLAAAASIAWASALASREHRRPPRVFSVSPDGAMALDAMPIEHCEVHWRGPLAFVRARDIDGRVHRLAFWPDTLGARGRRRLRLAIDGTEPPPTATSRRSRRGMRG